MATTKKATKPKAKKADMTNTKESLKEAADSLKGAAKSAKKAAESFQEEFKNIKPNELLGKIKEIIQEGNVRRIIIKNEKGNPVIEFPMTLGVVGVLLAPYLAAAGALAAVLTSCSIVVEKKR